MPLDSELPLHILEAVGLGLSVALILWLLGRYKPVRRVRVALVLATLMAGLYLIIYQSGLPGEPTLVKLISAIGILAAANAGLQLFDVLLWDYVIGQRRRLAVPRLLIDIFNFVILLLVALAVLNTVFEVDLTALLVTSTVLSAVIGLSLQDMLGNVIAGLALQLEQPFKVGDWVQIGGHEGWVVQMNWRTLTLRTRDQNDVILPNAHVAKNEFSNFSRPTALQRLHAQVSVAYSHPPGEVQDVLARAVAEVEGVCGEPEPEILVKAYADFAVVYDVRYWITNYARAQQIQGAVMARMWYALRRAGMKIPLPVREVTLRTLSDDHQTRAQEQLRHQTFAVLRQLPLLTPLNDAQIERLAHNAQLQRFTAGEALVRQGEPGSSLYVITAGEAQVEMIGNTDRPVTVGVLSPGEFFGEMSLLTGEPRSASVIARAETEVVVVDKVAFAEVIAADTPIVEALSLALESRMRKSAEQVASDAMPLPDRRPAQQAALLKRIRGFFGLDSD
ncbi:MAG TPA: mechanosensitive ion channel family protein [Anaerolineae bacterium]|nr:mechanosensitive ion channel family protein [Anaerolineae bacterium]